MYRNYIFQVRLLTNQESSFDTLHVVDNFFAQNFPMYSLKEIEMYSWTIKVLKPFMFLLRSLNTASRHFDFLQSFFQRKNAAGV